MQDNHSFFSSVATIQCNSNRYLLSPGNIVPHHWYKSFTINGCPDLTAITILADIVAWWRNSDKIISTKDSKSPNFHGEFLSISYEYLHDKFGFNKETARRALVRLEKACTLTRHVKNIKLQDGTRSNRLFIILDQNFYQACFRSSDYDIRIESSSHPARAQDAAGFKGNNIKNSNDFRSPLKCGDHISNNTEGLRTRSNESNFIKSILEEKKGDNFLNDERSNINESIKSAKIKISSVASTNLFDKVKAKFTGNKRKSFAESYPITEKEVSSLQKSSGREFNLNYMNKLVKKLGKQYPAHGFYTRELFLGYLSKALTNELRQESVVNNEIFKFKGNDEETRKQNYLSKVEESRGTCMQSQLKKKIAASFDTDTSYKLLKSCTFRDKIQNNIFEVITSASLDLTDNQHTILIDLTRSVYGNETEHINFIMSHSSKIDTPSELPILNLGKEGSIWNKVSKKLLEHYGEGIHRSWFSKLEEESKTQDRLILKAPTNFIGDWIKSNYLDKIYELLECFGYDFKDIKIMS